VGQANEVVVDYIDETHNDTQPVGDDGSRWGSGEVRVEAVEVFDEAGRPAPRLHSGQSVTIRLGYNARTRIQDPVFGLGIEAADGRTLWGSNTREAGLSIDFIEGPGTIEFTIPSLPLQGESFDLVSAITDQSTTHIYDFLRGCVRLDVDSARPAESGGPVSLSGRWSSVRSGDRPAHRPFAVSSDFTD
jgi:ABC-2 type transport system ATP-binding protein